MLDVARHRCAGRTLQERDELRADRSSTRRPGLDARGGPAAALETRDLGLRESRGSRDGSLREARGLPGVPEAASQAHSDLRGALSSRDLLPRGATRTGALGMHAASVVIAPLLVRIR
jgi:hypothetical protein